MRNILKKILIRILQAEARLVLIRFKPKIIAVVGSVGKTSAKDAIYTALKDTLYVRKNQKSLNSEIGIPLTILGLENAHDDWLRWAGNVIRGAFVWCAPTYPQWLVLEIGVDRPGDMERAGAWLKPTVAVMTSLPDVPVHVEFFESPEHVAEEKKKIFDYVAFDGAIIACADDSRVLAAAKESRSKVKTLVTYGVEEAADVAVSHIQTISETLRTEGVRGTYTAPTGLSLKINYGNNSIPVPVHGVLGIQHAFPVAAAIATGLALDIPLIDMTTALQYHRPPKGRMNIIDGKDGITIIDDSYNASPAATERAVETLATLEGKERKIAILGDMLEIGRYTAREHKRIGRLVAEGKIGWLFAVGVRAADYANEAIEAGMKKKCVFHVDALEDAPAEIVRILTEEKIVKPGTVVLVKGSQSMRMERIIEALMAHPEQKEELLVRQGKGWR